MKSSTAAAFVGAAIVSTLVFPFAGLALRRGGEQASVGEGGLPAPA